MPEADSINSDRGYFIKLWIAVFLYTACAAVFIQCILLNFIFPGWNEGNGLLISSFDSRTFHSVAVELVEEMRSKGLSAWQLRPHGHPPAGIAALIYYVSKISKPWMLIPLNAALHATAALALFAIVKIFLKDSKKALLSLLPFCFYPSAAVWYSQIHKDGYFILGSYLFLLGWLLLIRANRNEFGKHLRFSIFLILSGILLIWIIRPYFVKLFFIIDIIFAIITAFFFFYNVRVNKISRRKAAVSFLAVCAITSVSFFFTRDYTSSDARNISALAQKSPAVNEITTTATTLSKKTNIKTGASIKLSNAAINKNKNSANTVSEKPIIKKKFNSAIDHLVFDFDNLIAKRDLFLAVEGKSNIDENITFDHRREALIYFFTRAIQISLFAPFPSEWLKPGSCEINTIMRRIVIFEMLGIYFALCFLPFAIWFWRKRIEIFMILIFSFLFLSILGFIICNVGTLYRFRYGFIMLLVALGIARASLFLKDSTKNKPNK